MASATVLRDLDCYSSPDTSQPSLKMLSPGVFAVLDTRRSETVDYLELDGVKGVPNQRAWVCSRWEERVYARLYEGNTRAELFTVPEEAIISLLPEFYGYTYVLHGPRYPYSIPYVPGLPLEPPAANNCCTFVEGLLAKAWCNTITSGFRWSEKRHGQMMIWSLDDYFSPVTAAVEARMAEEIDDPDAFPEPWTLVQAWKKRWSGGHTFIVLDSHRSSQRILTLESNEAFGMDGPGYREIGDLDKFPYPGADWFKSSTVWTWARFRETYPYMKLAKLAVDDVSWVARA